MDTGSAVLCPMCPVKRAVFQTATAEHAPTMPARGRHARTDVGCMSRRRVVSLISIQHWTDWTDWRDER